jgi:uncharacterized protein YcbK (DUF882 family)
MLPVDPERQPHARTARATQSARRTALSCAFAPCLAALLLTVTPLYAGAAAEIVHIVGKGQTLGRIAKRYRVSVVALREANGLRVGEHIHPGLSLVIPEKGKDLAAASKNGKSRGDKSQDRGKRGGMKAKEGAEKGEVSFARGPRRRGFVRLLRGTEKLEVQMLTRHGHLAPAALTGFSKVLRFYPTGAQIPVDPRLAALVGQVSDHFGGRPLHVVSGFRPYSPVQYTAHSNHNVGRAMDFSVEGVPNTTVRDFCRTFRNAGVGYYPNSTFVHLDVRAARAYWIDYSRPGEAPHYDSPSSQGSADEAAGDVEPHTGQDGRVDDGSTPPAETEPGSPETR